MAEQAYAYVTLIPVAKGFQRRVADELSGAAPAAATAGARTGKAFAGAVKAGIAVGAAAATTAVSALGIAVTKGFGRLQAIEQAQALLEGTGNSAAEVEQVMTDALASVKGTAFGLGDAAQVAATTVAAGIKPGQDLERVLKATADTAAVAGTSLGDIGSIINGVITTNKAYTGELNQLADRGIPIYQYLAEQVGVTAQEISDMASAGEISSDMLVTALEDNVGGAALNMGETTAGSFANVQAAVGRVGANLIGPIFGRFSDFFNAVIEGLGPVEEKAADFGEKIGEFLNPRIDRAVELARNLSVPLQTLSTTMGNLSDRAGSVAAFFSPIVQAFAGLAPLLPQLVPVIGMIAELFATIATEALTILVPVLADLIGTILPLLLQAFIDIAPTLVEFAAEMADALIPALANLASAVIPVLTTALQILLPVAEFLVNVFANMSPSVYITATAIFFAIKAFIAIKAAVIAAKVAMTTFYTGLLRTIVVLRAKATVLFTAMHRYLGLAGSMLKTVAAAIATRVQMIATAVVMRAQLIATTLRHIAVLAIQKAALVGTRIALIAQTVAVNAATIAQRAFNLALRMNPLGLIITLIAAVIAGLVYFFTQTEIGQAIWETFTAVFMETVSAIAEWFGYVFTEWLPGVWSSFTTFLSDGWDAFKGYFETALTAIGDFFKGIINGWISMFEGFINHVIGGINKLIDGINSVRIDVPKTRFTKAFSIGFNLPKVPTVGLPRLAEGGFVDSPTTALIGEAGPEVVMPLDRFESMMGMDGKGKTVNYYAAPNKSLDAEQELITAMRRVKVMA